MIITAAAWDSRSIEHIARHGVDRSEIEELLEGRCLKRRTRSDCYIIYGRSEAGRYLVAIVAPRSAGYAYVVTAREMTSTERKWFRRCL